GRVAHFWEGDGWGGEVARGGGVTALGVGEIFFFRRDAGFSIHRAEFRVGLELATGIKVVGPFDVNRAGYSPAASGSHLRAVVFAFAARVQDREPFLVQ